MFGLIIFTLIIGYILLFFSQRAMKYVKRQTFRVVYNLYAHTRLGRVITKREFKKAAEDLPNGHSDQKTFTYGALSVTTVAYGYDNYAYVLVDLDEKTAVVIDPGYEIDNIVHVVNEHHATLIAAFVTHKHWDHCLATSTLHRHFPDVPIIGSLVDHPWGCTRLLSAGDCDKPLRFGRFCIRAHATLGHTPGHLVYEVNIDKSAAITAGKRESTKSEEVSVMAPLADLDEDDDAKMLEIDENAVDESAPMLFTGDLLFLAGIGRMFEGTFDELYDALRFLGCMDDGCLVWPGHEYAKENCAFAAAVEPDNSALRWKTVWVHVQRDERMPTCPSTIGEEKSYNPFLRAVCNEDFVANLYARSRTLKENPKKLSENEMQNVAKSEPIPRKQDVTAECSSSASSLAVDQPNRVVSLSFSELANYQTSLNKSDVDTLATVADPNQNPLPSSCPHPPSLQLSRQAKVNALAYLRKRKDGFRVKK